MDFRRSIIFVSLNIAGIMSDDKCLMLKIALVFCAECAIIVPYSIGEYTHCIEKKSGAVM